MGFTRKDNPNYVRRTGDTGAVFVHDPRCITAAEREASARRAARATAKGAAADRGARRHMLAVQRAMPYIRRCRKRNKVPRGLSQKLLNTVAKLRLV